MLIARPHSLQVHAGINKLLMAEKEATEVVKAAKEGERPLRLRSIYRCAQPQSPCEASQHTAPSCSPAHGRRSITNAHPRDRNTDPRATAAVPRPATRAEKVARLKLAKAEAERKEKERLAEILKNTIKCPHCNKEFQLNQEEDI